MWEFACGAGHPQIIDLQGYKIEKNLYCVRVMWYVCWKWSLRRRQRKGWSLFVVRINNRREVVVRSPKNNVWVILSNYISGRIQEHGRLSFGHFSSPLQYSWMSSGWHCCFLSSNIDPQAVCPDRGFEDSSVLPGKCRNGSSDESAECPCT